VGGGPLPLHAAVEHCSGVGDDRIRKLVAAGVNVNCHAVHDGSSRYTALHLATWLDTWEAVQILLELGADRRLRGKADVFEGTADDWAEQGGNADVLVKSERSELLSLYS
jgi:hypothetical protein